MLEIIRDHGERGSVCAYGKAKFWMLPYLECYTSCDIIEIIRVHNGADNEGRGCGHIVTAVGHVV